MYYIRKGLLLTVILFLVGLSYACNNGKAEQSSESIEDSTKTVFPKKSDNFNVLLLPFHPDEKCKAENTEMEEQLISFIQSSEWAQAMNIDVRLLQDQECPYKPKIAQKLGKEHNADVIIWGFYNKKEQKPQILYTWVKDVVEGHMGLPHLTDLRNGFYLKGDVTYIGNWMIGVAACKANKWAEALAHFEYIATDKCDVAVTPMIGHCYYALRKEPQVDSIMQIVVGCVPEYVGLAMRGWRHHISKKYQDAFNDYTASLKKNPRYKAAYEHRGTVLFERFKYKEAINEFTQSINMGTDEESIYSLRGIAYHNSGDREKAIVDYTKATELNPNNAKAYFDRANAHFILGHFDEAIKDYTMGISKETSTTRAYLNRGITYVELSNYEAAIADITHVLEKEPENVTALTYRGAAYSFHGKTNEAEADFIKALALDPDNQMALKGRDYVNKIIDMKELADEMDRLENEAKDQGIILPKYENGVPKFDLSNQPKATPQGSK